MSGEGDPEGGDDQLDPERWYGKPGVCGSCIAWRPEDPRPGEAVAPGTCRLRPELRRVPASLTRCGMYKPRGQFVYHPGQGADARGERPRRRSGAATTTVVRRNEEGETVSARAVRADRVEAVTARLERAASPAAARAERLPFPRPEGWSPPRAVDVGTDSPPFVESALVELLREELGRSRRELAQRFKQGGKVELVAADGRRAALPVTRLFSMLDRLRSSMDALERAVERTPGLAPERAELVGHVRRMHGSLTTFNVLFADREDQFSGKE